MASLRDIVRKHRKNITDGIAWVVIYKEGRSWNGNAFWSEAGDNEDGFIFDKGDLEQMVEIAKTDHKAICFNGYVNGISKDFTLAEMETKVLHFYETRRLQLNADFLDCMVCNLDEVETPGSEALAGTYIREYEDTLVTIKDTREFPVGELGYGDFYNPVVYELSDGTYWFSDSNETVHILESLVGVELVFDGDEGWVVKTRRGTRSIRWAN